MSAQTDALIASLFNWRDYFEGPPDVQTLPLEKQRELVATYLTDNPDELWEMLAYLHETDAATVAKMICGAADHDSRTEFDGALFNASIGCFSLSIEDRISIQHEAYCQEHGVFEMDSIHGPGEMIGWRNEHGE